MPKTTSTKRKTHNPYQVKAYCNLSIADIIAIKIKNKNKNKNKNKTSQTLVLPVHQDDGSNAKSQTDETKVIVEHSQLQEQEHEQRRRQEDDVSDQNTQVSPSSLLPPAPRSSQNNINSNDNDDDDDDDNNNGNNTLSIADIIAIKNKNKRSYNRSRSIFSGILNLCPNPGFDILRFNYATDLQMPGNFSGEVPQDGKKTKLVAAHLPRHVIKKHGTDGVHGILGAIGNRFGFPVYGPELDEQQGVCLFSTEESCACRAIAAFQGRVLFDVDCFWYAYTDVGVQIMDRWCKMMKFFAQTRPHVLDHGLPLTAMTAFVHRHCFNQGTVFPLWLNDRLTLDDQKHKPKKDRISFSWCDHNDSWNFFQFFYQQNLHVLTNQHFYQYPQGAPVPCPIDYHHHDQQVVDDFQREAEKYFRQHH